MKVSCKKCHKLFDYDEYMGICPECGSYYSLSPTCNHEFGDESSHLKGSKTVVREYNNANTGNYKNNNNSSKNKGKDENYNTKPPKYSWSDSSVRRTKSNKIPGYIKGIIIFIIVINFGMPLLTGVLGPVKELLEENFGEYIEDNETYEDVYEEDVYDETVSEEVYQDDVVQYTCEGMNWNIRIIGAAVDSSFDNSMPDGYEMVSVTYTVNNDIDNGLYPPEALANNIKPYIMTTDGNCIEPMFKEEIGKLLGIEEQYLEESLITDSFTLPLGNMYFFMEKGSADKVLINVINEAGEMQTSYIDI